MRFTLMLIFLLPCYNSFCNEIYENGFDPNDIRSALKDPCHHIDSIMSNTQAWDPICQHITKNFGCDAPTPSGVLDLGNVDCSNETTICLSDEYIACGANANINSVTNHGFIGITPKTEQCYTFNAAAQGANKNSGGQWVWGDVKVLGYRRDLSLDDKTKSQICQISHTGQQQGTPWREPPSMSCVGNVLFCGSTVCGACVSN